MIVHGFGDRLAYSHEQADQPWWEEVYRVAFPDMLSMVDLRHDGWHQKAGRDRAIVLGSGKTIYVDEKARSETYPDILIEVWSIYPKSKPPSLECVTGAKPGWAADGSKDCDWLAYAFVPTRVCHLLPFLAVRAALERFKTAWAACASSKTLGFRWVPGENGSYTTWSIAVPITRLKSQMSEALTVHWQMGGG